MSFSALPRFRSWRTRIGRLAGVAAIGVAATAAPLLAAQAHAATARPAAYHPWRAAAATAATKPPAPQAVMGTAFHPRSSFDGTISLGAVPTTLIPGTHTTLTASTSSDVGPTPFYTEIFDATTGQRLATCAFGTTCSISTTELALAGPATQSFVAYVSADSAEFPPSGIRATSATSYVTWAWSSFRLSLSARPAATDGVTTLTATANGDIGTTPYFIEIFDESDGTLITECPSGSACSMAYTPPLGDTNLVAFVASYGTSLPPASIQASSNVVLVTGYLLR